MTVQPVVVTVAGQTVGVSCQVSVGSAGAWPYYDLHIGEPNVDDWVANDLDAFFAAAEAHGYPVPSTVGLAGVGIDPSTLTPSGSITTTAHGQIIEGLDITGKLTIRHAVTVRRCRFNGRSDHAIDLNDTPNSAGAIIEDCDINLAGQNPDWVPIHSYYAHTVRRCYVYEVGRACKMYDNATYIGNVIVSNLSANTNAHRGSIGCNGGHDNTVIGNTCIALGSGTSACFPHYGDVETCVRNRYEGNLLLATAAFLAYGGSSGSKEFPNAEDIAFIDNAFSTHFWETGGRAGFIAGWDGGVRGNVATGNHIFETGALLSFNTG